MSTATDMRDAYIAAEVAVLKGQTYRFGERQLTLANLPEIRAGRVEWEVRVATEQRIAARQRGGVIGFSVSGFNPGADGSLDGHCP